MIHWGSHFERALGYDAFLEQHAEPNQISLWDDSLRGVTLTDEQHQVLATFKRELNVICLAGAWCGDCAEQCPILRRFALTTDRINLRFIDRDADPELQKAFMLCGAPRVPQAVFLSEDMTFIGHYGDRTLTRYRHMGSTITGGVCATGLSLDGDPVRAGVIQDWLNEFERAHWIVRLSPRLRQKHGD